MANERAVLLGGTVGSPAEPWWWVCCPAGREKGWVTGGPELPGAHPAPVAACVNKVEHKLMYNQKVQNTPFLKRLTVAWSSRCSDLIPHCSSLCNSKLLPSSSSSNLPRRLLQWPLCRRALGSQKSFISFIVLCAGAGCPAATLCASGPLLTGGPMSFIHVIQREVVFFFFSWTLCTET